MIEIEINGKRYGGFEEITIKKSLDAVCGVFSFVTTYKALNGFPINQNDKCKIYINNESVIVGFIEGFDISYGADYHTITVSGRDRTADIVDSSFGNELKIKPPISLQKICEKVVHLLGMNDVDTISDCEIDVFGTNDVLVSGHIGINAFHFLDTYARMRQVILTTGYDGNLLLTRSGNVTMSTILVNRLNGESNNILSADLVTDISKRFNKYGYYSTENICMLSLPGAVHKKPKELSNNKQVYIDTEIRTSRLYSKKKERSSSNKTKIKNRAEWEARIRKVRGFSYQAVVQGFNAINDNTLWKPGQIVHIEDDMCQLYGSYLINDVTYELSGDSGSLTTINFVDKNAYNLKLEIDSSASSGIKVPWSMT